MVGEFSEVKDVQGLCQIQICGSENEKWDAYLHAINHSASDSQELPQHEHPGLPTRELSLQEALVQSVRTSVAYFRLGSVRVCSEAITLGKISKWPLSFVSQTPVSGLFSLAGSSTSS